MVEFRNFFSQVINLHKPYKIVGAAIRVIQGFRNLGFNIKNIKHKINKARFMKYYIKLLIGTFG